MKTIVNKVNKNVTAEQNGPITVKLCFENLQSTYVPGYLVTENKAAKENNKAMKDLVKFARLIVDDKTLNESTGTSTIYVSAVVSTKENMQKLNEWIETYAGKENVDKIAPGLLESLKDENQEENEETDNEETVNEESVASRFAKYRKLYEDTNIEEQKPVNEDDSVSEEDSVSENSDQEDNKDDAAAEDNKDDNNKDDDNKDDDKDDKDEDEDEDEQDELTAVILEVAKGDEDKAKDELIEAGVDEDDIEIVDDKEDEKNEDEDEDKEETVKIKVAVDSFDALKEYLEGKGFNLEEELGGEIVTGDDEEESDKEDKEDSEEDIFSDFDDLDLFGGDEEGEDK